jgi:hypothetical protein
MSEERGGISDAITFEGRSLFLKFDQGVGYVIQMALGVNPARQCQAPNSNWDNPFFRYLDRVTNMTAPISTPHASFEV